MDQCNILIPIKDAFGPIQESVNAVELMVLGLSQAHDPYAEGFHTVWLALRESVLHAEKLLDQALSNQ